MYYIGQLLRKKDTKEEVVYLGCLFNKDLEEKNSSENFREELKKNFSIEVTDESDVLIKNSQNLVESTNFKALERIEENGKIVVGKYAIPAFFGILTIKMIKNIDSSPVSLKEKRLSTDKRGKPVLSMG